MSLCQLRELATRQQDHIETTQRMINQREQHLKSVKQDHLNSTTKLQEQEDKLNRLRESVTAQEIKLRQLKSLKGQVQKQRCNSTNLCKLIKL